MFTHFGQWKSEILPDLYQNRLQNSLLLLKEFDIEDQLVQNIIENYERYHIIRSLIPNRSSAQEEYVTVYIDQQDTNLQLMNQEYPTSSLLTMKFTNDKISYKYEFNRASSDYPITALHNKDLRFLVQFHNANEYVITDQELNKNITLDIFLNEIHSSQNN